MRAKPKFRGSAGLFEVLGAGGQEGFNVLREGRKDIRQSEEAILSARAKMMEAQSLRDQNKFKLADEVDNQARDEYKLGVDLANTQSAINLRNSQAEMAARKLPAEIGLLEAQADYARSGGRTAAADQKAADDYAKSKLLMSGILPNSPDYMTQYANFRNEYLTSIAGGGGVTQIPVAPAGGAGGARFVGFEGS
jgi:septal ring factor EnvC (AmiA/AmiB activator)